LVSRRTFAREFKLSICREVESGSLSKGQACRTHALSATLLAKWLDQYRAKGEEAFDGADWRAMTLSPEARTRDLEAALGRAHMEIELLREALAKKLSGLRSGVK
jgi:transposase-like protein